MNLSFLCLLHSRQILYPLSHPESGKPSMCIGENNHYSAKKKKKSLLFFFPPLRRDLKKMFKSFPKKMLTVMCQGDLEPSLVLPFFFFFWRLCLFFPFLFSPMSKYLSLHQCQMSAYCEATPPPTLIYVEFLPFLPFQIYYIPFFILF